MSGRDRNRRKICHCRPDCNRLLGIDQRKNHYQLVSDPLTIRRSTTPPDHELSEFESTDESMTEDLYVGEYEHQDNEDIGMADIADGFGEASSTNSEDNDAGQEAGDGFYDGSDEELPGSDSEDEWNEPLLSLDEMREVIEDELGPGMDLEMWKLCELILQ